MRDARTEFALKSTRVVTVEGVRVAAVLVRDGRILDVVAPDGIPGGWQVDDVGDLVVMPGLVDTHVHINEPGRTQWEGFETGTRAAAAGGVTTIIDMPLNCIPATTTVAALTEKVRVAQGKLWVDCGFYGGVVPGNAAELPGLAAAGVYGFKAFLTDSGVPEFAAVDEADVRAAMAVIASTRLPLLVHAELPTVTAPDPANPASYTDYLASRPRRWENDAIELVIRLGDEYGCPIHIVHLSSSDALAVLAQARESGGQVTTETCPHYLFFSADEIGDGDTLLKCAPPIRERANNEQLWEALSEGIIDLVVTDHSPSPPALKCLESGDFFEAWGGIASLQLGLATVWTSALGRGISIDRVAEWMCAGPARLVGLFGKKGVLRAGADADIVVWNPEASSVVAENHILHRHKRTPYEGRTLFGVVEKTFLRGAVVYGNGAVVGSPRGRTMRRGDT